VSPESDVSTGTGMPSYLPEGLPAPVAAPDGLDTPFWEGLANDQLVVQKCGGCGRFQWGPEWVCHRCHSLDMGWEAIDAHGVIYSHERVWHPVHPALREHGPYIVVLVEMPDADGIRFVGNLLGDPEQPLDIGTPVTAAFEHHPDNDPPFTLLQWHVSE